MDKILRKKKNEIDCKNHNKQESIVFLQKYLIKLLNKGNLRIFGIIISSS